jgi:hypothetical protein
VAGGIAQSLRAAVGPARFSTPTLVLECKDMLDF